MNPVSSMISWWLKRRMSQIDLVMASPLETQMQQWKYLLEKGKETTWGKKFNYQKIDSLEAFRESVPSLSYEET